MRFVTFAAFFLSAALPAIAGSLRADAAFAELQARDLERFDLTPEHIAALNEFDDDQFATLVARHLDDDDIAALAEYYAAQDDPSIQKRGPKKFGALGNLVSKFKVMLSKSGKGKHPYKHPNTGSPPSSDPPPNRKDSTGPKKKNGRAWFPGAAVFGRDIAGAGTEAAASDGGVF